MYSADGAYDAVMQTDGNLVVYGPGGVNWSSGTGVAGSFLAMQSDGNAVIYAPSGTRRLVFRDGTLEW